MLLREGLSLCHPFREPQPHQVRSDFPEWSTWGRQLRSELGSARNLTLLQRHAPKLTPEEPEISNLSFPTCNVGITEQFWVQDAL